LSLWQW